MKKRFMSTGLHRKAWFRNLPLRLREAWRILLAECNEIGLWEINLEFLNFQINEPNGLPIDLTELLEHFEVRLVDDDKLFIEGFVAFQYGDEEGRLSRKNKMVPKLLRMLKARDLPQPRFKEDEPDASPLDAPSDHHLSTTYPVKEEEEVEEEIQEEVEDQVEEVPAWRRDPRAIAPDPDKVPVTPAERNDALMRLPLAALWDLYPRCQKRGVSIDLMVRHVRDQEAADALRKQITNYSAYCEREHVELRHRLTFPSFWAERQDWSDSRNGSGTAAGQPVSRLERLRARVEANQ